MLLMKIYHTNFWPIPKFHVQLITCSSQLKRHDFKISRRRRRRGGKKSTQIIIVITITIYNFVNWNLCSKTTLFIEAKFKYLIFFLLSRAQFVRLLFQRLLLFIEIHFRYIDQIHTYICIVLYWQMMNNYLNFPSIEWHANLFYLFFSFGFVSFRFEWCTRS